MRIRVEKSKTNSGLADNEGFFINYRNAWGFIILVIHEGYHYLIRKTIEAPLGHYHPLTLLIHYIPIVKLYNNSGKDLLYWYIPYLFKNWDNKYGSRDRQIGKRKVFLSKI